MSINLWQQIPPDSRLILFFGCGDGRGVLALQQQNPQANVLGVESNQALRQQAQSFGLQLYANAAEVLMKLQTESLQPDAWLLDKKAWRDETLSAICRQALLNSLATAATVVWEILAQKNWEALQTEQTMRDFSQAGIAECEVLESVTGNQAEQTDWVVIRGRKHITPIEMLTITAILGEPQACARVRLDEPHAFLSTLPLVRYSRHIELTEAKIEPTGNLVWIWQRLMFQKARLVNLQQRLLGRKALTIQEWDDDPLRWESHFQSSEFLEFRSAHAIQTSTQALADQLRPFNSEVRVFPNCVKSLPPLRWPTHQLVTIFFGALNRQEDWKPILQALNQVLHRFNKKIRLIVVWDREFFAAVEAESKIFIPYCAYPQYLELLQRSDIALLPLLPTPFNRLKSDLKFLECAAMGTVALASPTVYRGALTDGQNGFLYENAEEFSNRLSELIGDKELRQRLAESAWQWVRRNRLLSMHYRDRLAWYQSLFDRYEELTEALLLRSPELRR